MTLGIKTITICNLFLHTQNVSINTHIKHATIYKKAATLCGKKQKASHQIATQKVVIFGNQPVH